MSIKAMLYSNRFRSWSESDEYYIIAEGNSYSLSNYDHIALNGDSVRDNFR